MTGNYIIGIVIFSVIAVVIIVLLILYYKFIVLSSKKTEKKLNKISLSLAKNKIIIYILISTLFIGNAFILYKKVSPNNMFMIDYRLVSNGKYNQFECTAITYDKAGKETDRSVTVKVDETGEEMKIYFVGSPVNVGDRFLIIMAPDTKLYVVIQL